MESFNRENLRELRTKLEAALKTFGDENGIVFSFGSITFSGNQCHTKLNMTAIGEATDASEAMEAMEKTKFERYAKIFGLEPEHFGATVKVRGESFTITGINPNRPKFPISATRSDGKQFKLGIDTVKMGLGLPLPFMLR